MNKVDTTDGRRDGTSVLTPGTLIRRVALGSKASYRIVGENDHGVEVEVVEAPGLQPRTRFTFTTADVIKMTDSEPRRADDARRAKRAIRDAVPKGGHASVRRGLFRPAPH